MRLLVFLHIFWLFSEAAVKNIPASEYAALHSLYYSTNGNSWRWRTPTTILGQIWNFSTTLGKQPNPCVLNWQGINCSSTCLNGGSFLPCHVVDLHLPEYNLNGTLPQALGNLTKLFRLDLSYNLLYGTIPSSIGSITELVTLQLVSNPPTSVDERRFQLSGTIPEEIYSLQRLSICDLSFNSISGTISSTISGLSNLFAFYVEGNELTGSIPSEFGLLNRLFYTSFAMNDLTSSIPYQIQNLSNLNFIDLSSNRLTGRIPTTLGRLTAIKVFAVYNNSLTGPLPEQLSHLKDMWLLAADFNGLSGSIPASLGNAERLRYLWIQGNSLTGTLPSQLSLLANCSEFVFDLNHFTGAIPSEYGRMPSLSILNLAYNSITGTIPSELGQLIKMQKGVVINSTSLTDLSLYTYVNLGVNLLSGTLPSTLGLWTHINNLLFYDNHLSGIIPTEFGSFEVISTFAVDSNSLSGTIPSVIGNWKNLASLLLDRNRFTGTLPTEFGLMLSLYTLSLQGNSVHGTLPTELGKLSNLTVLSLCDNAFTGTIPSILESMIGLKTLLLANNYLHGQLEPIFSPLVNHSLLNTVDLSNNNFCGLVPTSIFALKSINSISLIKNCFHGSIPLNICNASSTLSVIALDGLSAGESCNTVIFSLLHTYTSKYMEGSLPSCVFSLLGLTTLQLSGNGLRGTLPVSLPEQSILRNVSLSNNRLGGTIPTVFQKFTFDLLDLSNNRFSGTINDMENFFRMVDDQGHIVSVSNNATMREPQLVLNDNRISGSVPASFRQAENVDVVGGNFFGCDDTSQLPQNDPATATAECGSNTLNILVILFAAGFSVLGLICFLKLYLVWRDSRTEGKVEENSSEARMSTAGEVMSSASVYDVEVIYFTSMLPEIRGMIFLFAIPITCLVLLPLYLLFKYVNNAEYSTYTYQYGLTPSVAFLEGVPPLITFWALFLSLSMMVLVLFGWMNDRIRKRADEISRKLLKPLSMQISWDEIDSVYTSSASQSNLSGKDISFFSRAGLFLGQPTVLNSAFVFVNVTVFFLVNGGFVYIILTYGQVVSVIAQVVLVAFKLGWNQFVIPNVLHRINYKRDNDSSHEVASKSLMSILSSKVGSSRDAAAGTLRSTSIDLNTMLVLFNTIVIPIILVMVESFNCYYYAFESQDAITLVQYYKVCHEMAIDGHCVDFEQEISTSFVPPFIYNFGCSNALLINYTSVFVLMYIYLGLASPLLHLSLPFIMFSCPNDPPSYLDRLLICAEEYVNFLPAHFGTEKTTNFRLSAASAAVHQPSTENTLNSAVVPLTGWRKFVCNYCVRKYSSVDKIVCRLISDFAILFTFGMAYPPLAVIVCLSVFIESFEWVLMVTRNNQLLRCGVFTQKNSGNDSSVYSLRCQGVIDLFRRFRWVLVTLMCWFFGFILFDMSAGTGNLSLSLCTVIFFWPLILYCCKRLRSWCESRGSSGGAKKRPQSDVLPAVELRALPLPAAKIKVDDESQPPIPSPIEPSVSTPNNAEILDGMPIESPLQDCFR